MVALLAGASLLACGSPGELSVEDAYVVPSPSGTGPAGGFLVLRNESGTMRSLVGADSPHAARVELHRSWIEDGVARMAREEAIQVPAGTTVRFEPGGLHLMLFDAQLTPGRPVPLRLWFDDGSLREVVARVAADAGDSHAGHEHHAH